MDGVDWVRRRVRVDGELQSQFIYNQNSSGDKIIEAGEACEIKITKTVNFNFTGAVMQAPSIKRQGMLATSWGALKRLQ